MTCGTRGIPGTVAPFRAWRGSRDLVAQSPKFHAPADALSRASASKSLAQGFECSQNGRLFSIVLRWRIVFGFPYDFGLAAAAGLSGCSTSDGFTQFTLNGPAPSTCTMVSPLQDAKCRISLGTVTKFPTFIVSGLVSSYGVAHAYEKDSLEHGDIFIRWMPMCGDPDAIGTPYPQNERLVLAIQEAIATVRA